MSDSPLSDSCGGILSYSDDQDNTFYNFGMYNDVKLDSKAFEEYIDASNKKNKAFDAGYNFRKGSLPGYRKEDGNVLKTESNNKKKEVSDTIKKYKKGILPGYNNNKASRKNNILSLFMNNF